MCIFVAPVRRVTNTRILIAPLSGGRQLTVYENQVAQLPGSRNAMVLPVPAGLAGGGVEMVDLSNYTGDVWRDCEALMPPDSPRFTGGGEGWGAASFSMGAGEKAPPPLPVRRVGGYQTTVVPSLEDFSRVQREVFELPQDIEAILREHYARGFSFVVCIFTGDVAAHPIAYTSSRLPNGLCFVPTRHAHGAGATVDPNTVVHKDVRCDVCNVMPIVGHRYKCLQCPNYDMCASCYTQRRGAHAASHVFADLARPLETTQFGSRAVQSRSAAVGGGFMFIGGPGDDIVAEDDFDHTIYLLNAVLAAAPKRYTNAKTADLRSSGGNPNWRGGLQQLPLVGPEGGGGRWECITRVTIKGGDFPNQDYACTEVY